MAPEIAAALISGGIALTGTMGSAGISNARNMRLARYAADFQREQIREQNAYNTPAAQLQRYKDAELNPNLIYGDGGASAGNQTSHATYDAPEYVVPDVGEPLGKVVNQAMSLALQRKNLDLMDQDLRNKQEEQFNIRAARMAQDIENMYNASITGFDPGLVTSQEEREKVLGGMRVGRYKSEIQGIEENIAYTRAREALTKMDTKQKQWIYDNMNQIQLDIEKLRKEGLGYENIVREVESAWTEKFKPVGGYGNVKEFANFVRAIISMFLPTKVKRL